MERFYNIAGIIYRITGADEEMDGQDGALAAYRTEYQPAWDHWLEMEIVDALPEPVGELVFSDPGMRVYLDGDTQLRYEGAVSESWQEAYMCILRRGNHSRGLFKRQSVWNRISSKMVLNSMEAEYQIVKKGSFLLHASYIRCGSGAIVFTAPSGTGKSTQADLWCKLRGAELINGDRAAVQPRKDGVWACGIPFAGSSGVSKNVALPLKAMVYLSQAPATNITKLSGFRAFRHIWEGCSVNVWNRDVVSACTQNVLNAVAAVPVFHLACTPDESAVIALENALNYGVKQ